MNLTYKEIKVLAEKRVNEIAIEWKNSTGAIMSRDEHHAMIDGIIEGFLMVQKMGK